MADDGPDDGAPDLDAAAGPGTRIDGRIAERRRSVRRERQLTRRRRTLVVVLSVVVIAALIAVERSPLVGIERVEVAGTERLTAAEVRAAADLEIGTSTLRLRLGEVEQRVAKLPLARTASARRLDPLTVHIDVEERVPALRVRAGDDDVLVDREGVVLAPADGSVDVPSALLPVRVSGSAPPLGERADTGTPMDAALRTWRGLSGPLRVEVEALRADAAGDVELTLRSGTEVRMGDAQRLDEKVRALGAVLEDLEGTPVQAIDVTAPGRPAVDP